MKPDKVLQRMQPLLAPLRESLSCRDGYDRRWEEFGSSLGEIYIHAVAAMTVRQNGRLGDRRLVEEAMEAASTEGWMNELSTAIDEFIPLMKEVAGSSVFQSSRVANFMTAEGKRFGQIMLKPSRAYMVVFSGVGDGIPMWLSRSSTVPILDPHGRIELTMTHMDSCIAMMREEMTIAGVPDADRLAIEMGRRCTGNSFVPHRGDVVTMGEWNRDPTSMSVEIPHTDLSMADEKGRSVVGVDAYGIVHGPLHELREKLAWHAARVAEVVASRADVMDQIPRVRAIIEHAAASKGSPRGGVLAGYRVTQSGKSIAVECDIIGYDADSYRRKIRRVNFRDETAGKLEKPIVRELEKACRDYAKYLRITGRAPYETNDVDHADLGPFTIDAPLLTMVNERLPGRLREIVCRLLVKGETPEDVRPGFYGPMQGVSITLEAGCIRGCFELGSGVSWRGGKLRMEEVSLPHSLRTALVGMPVSKVVQHADLCDDMTITGTSTRSLSSGREVTYVHLSGATRRLAEVVSGDAVEQLVDS